MKPEKDELFSLIKSMSKSEKRYFKLGAKKSGETKSINYLKVFDALNDMEEYDEEKLRKKFKKEKFIDHLSSEKRYLYQAILKSLRQYRSENSAYAQIKEMILDAGYLQERGLYKQALKVLKKAKKSAESYEDSYSCLEINTKEREILRHVHDKNYSEQLSLLITEKNELLKNLDMELRFLDLTEELNIMRAQQLELKNSERIQEVKDKLKTIEETIEDPTSYNTLHNYYLFKSVYHQLLGEIEETNNYFNEVMQWWDEHPHIKEEKFHRYRIAISNLISSFVTRKEHQYILPLIEKLEKEAPKNFHEQGILFQKISISKLLYYINIGENDSAEELVPYIKTGLDKYQINPSSRLTLIGNVAIFYFSIEKFEECAFWFDKVINGQGKNYRLDIQFLSRLLNIICHYEIKTGQEYVESLCRSLYRFNNETRKKQKRGQTFESEVISMLKKLLSTPEYEKKKALLELKAFLEEQRSGARLTPGTEELLLWVNSKITSKPILELLKNHSS